jgi:hypothetical protein
MTSFTNSNFFDYGYPDDPKTPWFGLWCPILDCFLMVSFDLSLLEKLQMLMSSKTILQLVRLDPITYENNQIDNECCYHWTIELGIDIKFNSTYKNYKEIPKCQITQRNTDVKDLKLREWIWFLHKWVRITRGVDNRIENFLQDVLNYEKTETHVISKIYKELLLGDDSQIVENNIASVLQEIKDTHTYKAIYKEAQWKL